jgi:hypothetical protein
MRAKWRLTAAFVDLERSLGAHLPAVLGIVIVIGSTLVIRFLMSGSVKVGRTSRVVGET